jgi:hypothetical protein
MNKKRPWVTRPYISLGHAGWLLLLIEYASRWLIGQFKPFETVSTAPGAIGNYVFVILSLLMLVWYALDYKKLTLKF